MPSEAPIPFRPFCSVQTVLLRSDEILLARRSGTGFEDGKYGLIGGHIDGGEPAREAAVREAAEEAGIVIDHAALEHIHTLHRLSPDREYIDIFFACRPWSGSPAIREPDRCDELAWFPVHDLPDDTIDYVRTVIERSRGGSRFGELGWSTRRRGGVTER